MTSIRNCVLALMLAVPMVWAQGTYQGPGGGGGGISSIIFTSPLTGGTITTSGQTVGVVLSAVNPQTGTYQVLASDFSNYKTITVASGTFTITLVASGSQPANGQYIDIVNYGSGTVTIARSGQNINGGTSSLTLGAASATAPQSTTIISDGTNYYATGIAGNGGVASVQFDANPALTGAIAWTSGTGVATSQSGNTVTVSTNNATGAVQGTIVLAGDLGGTATSPQVVGGTHFTSPIQNGTTNNAMLLQAGIDGTTGGATAVLTLRGEDVTGGSTASIAGGAVAIRGGNTASTGNSNAGGNVTINGGNATGGTGTSDVAGSVTATGGNCTATTGSCTPGSVTVTSGGFTAAFTNGAAADHIVAAGLGTGNAAVSHVKLQSPALSQTSGTTAQSQVTRWVEHVKAGSTSSGTPTSMFNIPLAASTTAGVFVTVHVETTQATPHNCSTTESFTAVAQNTASTITQQTTTGQIGTICDTGTLTMTAAFSTANPTVFSVTPSWTTIVPTAVTITIEIHNLSQQDVTLL